MIIVGLTNSKKIARGIAEKLNLDYEDLRVSDSRDREGEIHVKFKHNLKDKKVVLVQSLYPHPNYALFEVLFAASVARDLGASKLIYVAPYLGYLREEFRLEKGECVGMKVIGDLLSRSVDEIVTVEPHFHEQSRIKNFFSVPLHRVECNALLRSYVAKNFKDAEVVGVGDKAGVLAKHMSVNSFCHEKEEKKKIEEKIEEMGGFEDKKVVMVDDIIASGKSMMENLRKVRAKKVYLIAVHGLFVGEAYRNLKEKVEKIITTNTVFHDSNELGLDVSDLIARKLMEL